MDLSCIDCMRKGTWQDAETFVDGNALCAAHALTSSERAPLPPDQAEATLGQLTSTPRKPRGRSAGF
jgi:hypothetical protein